MIIFKIKNLMALSVDANEWALYEFYLVLYII